jgi:hypothetical protein
MPEGARTSEVGLRLEVRQHQRRDLRVVLDHVLFGEAGAAVDHAVGMRDAQGFQRGPRAGLLRPLLARL